MIERECDSGVEDEAIPIDSGASPYGVEMLATEQERGLVFIMHLGMVPEEVALDRRPPGAHRNAASVANLCLGSPAPVAEQ